LQSSRSVSMVSVRAEIMPRKPVRFMVPESVTSQSAIISCGVAVSNELGLASAQHLESHRK
jgi:hypothetical protein